MDRSAGTRGIGALTFGALMLAVAGCSGAPCTGNPATDSLYCVQRGINTGGYQRRVDERQAEAREKTSQVEAAQAENQQLQNQIAEARAKEAELRSRLAAQRAELNRLADEVSRAAQAGQLTPGEASLRRTQIDYLRQRQAELEQSKAQNREMQQKAEALQHEINDLKSALAKRVI